MKDEIIRQRTDKILPELLSFLNEACGIEPKVIKSKGYTYLQPGKQQLIKINICFPEAGLHNRDEQVDYAKSNIALYHFWEDLWYAKQEVVKSRMRSILGKTVRIYGRTTSVSRIDKSELLSFLHNNHTAIPINAKYKYGLFHKGQLVAVASFSSPRKFQTATGTVRSFELLRYTTLNHHTVVGGLSKLISAFSNDKSPDDIMTYIDNDWTTGKGFYRNKFNFIDILPPIKLYIDTHSWQRIHPGMMQANTTATPADAEKNDLITTIIKLVTVYNSGSIKLKLTF